jgi:hypothetical protein
LTHVRDNKRVERLEEACYGQLSPIERFRLSAEAAARDDVDAVNRLWDACPTHTYSQAGAAYTSRMRAAELICLAFYGDLNYVLGKALMADAISTSTPGMINDAFTGGYHAGYAAAGGNLADLEEDPDEEAETDALLTERSRRFKEAMASATASMTGARWEGFCRFARDNVGVEPDVLARAFMPPVDIANLNSLQFDEEDAADCHETLRNLCERRLELYGAGAAP